MKICADENVAPKLTQLVRETLLSKKHTLHPVDDFQARGVEDEIWVRKFAKDGGEAIVGADAMMLTRAHEVVAIADAGVRLVILPHQWARAGRHLQIAFLFLWWPSIERTIETCKPRQCFKVPWTWTPTPGELTEHKLDFQTARKKAQKADRRQNH